MNAIPGFLRMAAVAAIALMLMVAGAVFATSLIVAVLLVVAFGALGALLTGRKPTALVLWKRWREMRADAGVGRTVFSDRGNRRPRTVDARSGPAEVVDVEARDLPGQQR